MEAEIQATVKLWSAQIRGGSQDMGEDIGNLMADFGKLAAPSITDEQIHIFETVLAAGLKRKIVEDNNWNPDNPEFGSWCRSLVTDYGFDREITAAVDASGINRLHVPIKSYTLTCPGYVTHAFGYSARPQKLFVVAEKQKA